MTGMKQVEYYMSLKYRTLAYQDEEGDYIVEVPDLPGCAADGPTPNEAFESLREAKRTWMESRLAAGLTIPEPRQTEDYSGRVLLRMPRSLHRQLVEQADSDGVSLNQYIVSMLSRASEREQFVKGAVRIGQARYALEADVAPLTVAVGQVGRPDITRYERPVNLREGILQAGMPKLYFTRREEENTTGPLDLVPRA